VPKFLMVAETTPHAGREDDFNKWYEGTHIPELLKMPGVKSAERYKLSLTIAGQKPGHPYFTIYEIETDDVQKTLAAFGTTKLTQSDSFDPSTADMSIYQAVGTKATG
jgi:hypothetical protein